LRASLSNLTSESGYVQGDRKDYDRAHAVDLVKLLDFLQSTQPEIVEQLGIASDGPTRLKFLARLQGEIAKRGVVDILRKGIQHGSVFADLFFAAPSPGNIKAAERFAANIFSVTR
jgi:type I restriction enzyme, R subunit